MTELISTDRPISGPALDRLTALLDTLVPQSGDGRLPSAAELDFIGHLERYDRQWLDALSSLLENFDQTFASLTLAERVPIITAWSAEQPVLFRDLLQRVYDCYYQDVRVRTAIGVNPGPQFPTGNTVISGDLSLLDPVLQQSERHRYRPA